MKNLARLALAAFAVIFSTAAFTQVYSCPTGSEGSDPPTNIAATCSSDTSCTVTWNTAHNSNSWVVLGANDGSGGDARQYSSLALTTNHSVVVDHLMPGTSYAFYTASC